MKIRIPVNIILTMGLLSGLNNINALEIEDAVYQQQETAVNLARSGEYDSAVEILKGLVSKYPAEKRFLYDYIVVLSWSGQQELAFQNFQNSVLGQYLTTS